MEQPVHPLSPLVVAAWASLLVLPEPPHDGLQDGGKRRHTYPRGDEDCVLGTEHVARRGPIGTVDVDLVKK